MGLGSHGYRGFGMSIDGACWWRACWAHLGDAGYITGDDRTIPVCEVGTQLTHDWMDVERNLCAAE